MTKEEYDIKLKEMSQKHEFEMHGLYKEFAYGNAKYKVGDIVKDHKCVILVDKVTVSKFFGLPEAVYQGFELKKNLERKVNNARNSVYESNRIDLITNPT